MESNVWQRKSEVLYRQANVLKGICYVSLFINVMFACNCLHKGTCLEYLHF
jgi:hypothetical protein